MIFLLLVVILPNPMFSLSPSDFLHEYYTLYRYLIFFRRFYQFDPIMINDIRFLDPNSILCLLNFTLVYDHPILQQLNVNLPSPPVFLYSPPHQQLHNLDPPPLIFLVFAFFSASRYPLSCSHPFHSGTLPPQWLPHPS